MIIEALRKVVERQDLSREEALAVMEEIMSGGASDAQIAAFLAALRMKGETVEELTGFATVMREKVARVETKAKAALTGTDREALVDTCGTGGDASNTFNISTATAFVVAGAGLPVAKHGNRSVSSLCGSADVVEALGIDLELPPEVVGQCIDEVGIGFLYAPLLHKAMKYVMPARREIKIRTVFNILGPLTNPAGASAQVMGVYDGGLTETLATVLRELGSRRAFVVHGLDGLDEISNTGETRVSEVKDGKVLSYVITPEELGIKRVGLSDLKGGDAKENASIIKRILQGEEGPKREVVLLNAAAGIVAGGRAQGLKEGLEQAKDAIDNGGALERLIKLQEFCARHRRS